MLYAVRLHFISYALRQIFQVVRDTPSLFPSCILCLASGAKSAANVKNNPDYSSKALFEHLQNILVGNDRNI